MERCSQSKSTKQMFGPAASTFKISFFLSFGSFGVGTKCRSLYFFKFIIFFFFKESCDYLFEERKQRGKTKASLMYT